MKALLFSLFLCFAFLGVRAQVPQAIKYQGIIRTNNGDFDYNQEINVSDLLLLNANYGLTGICLDGDLDQDQKVKVSDVLIFFGAYGGVCD